MFLPMTKAEMEVLGWEKPDFVYICGDAYVDHPSFGCAIISRILQAHGFKVAMLPQPDWRDEKSVQVFGRPRLGFLVSAGNMDSMVNHYTVSKKRRRKDAYSPGGEAGHRPDYAVIVYCNLIRRVYGQVPVIIGGIEASLRRLAHYDYWSGKLRRSILLDSGADLLSYGMGERSVLAIAEALDSGIAVNELTWIPGTVYKCREAQAVLDGEEGILLPAYDAMLADRREYARSFGIQLAQTDPFTARPLVESYGEKRCIVQNPPSRPLSMQEMDDIYELPYENRWHPSYDQKGGVPALSEVKFSLTSSRGCFGGCSFCAIVFHEGRIVQARSHASLLREAQRMVNDPDFKGYIHDVGGPTADFRGPACRKQMEKGACPHRQCLFPEPCPQLIADHTDYLSLLRKLRKIEGVKKVFIRSGIRFDYVLADKNGEAFMREVCRHHVSGQLRVAPEHVTDRVLSLMGKPKADVYRKFVRLFDRINDSQGMQQYVLPYLISSHPGSELKDAVALAESIRDMGYMPEQVQDFYPTPSTISTVMYYTGLDPRNLKPVYIASDPHEKAMQRALLQYRKPENYALVREALQKAGRQDLIGFGRECLIPPRPVGGSGNRSGRENTGKSGRSGKRPVSGRSREKNRRKPQKAPK